MSLYSHPLLQKRLALTAEDASKIGFCFTSPRSCPSRWQQGTEIKYHIEDILHPAANNWLHFSSYWLLSRSCLGRDTEPCFMTAHRNIESSNLSTFQFYHWNSPYKEIFCFPEQVLQEGTKSYPSPLGQESLMDTSCWLCHVIWSVCLWLLCVRHITKTNKEKPNRSEASKPAFFFSLWFQQQPQRATQLVTLFPKAFGMSCAIYAVQML